MKMTKDELINSIKPNEANLDYIKSTHKINGSLLMDIHKAMDEYAKQEAIEFSEWLEEKHFWKSTDNRFPVTLGRWTTAINGDVPLEETFTSEQLYSLFKQTHL